MSKYFVCEYKILVTLQTASARVNLIHRHVFLLVESTVLNKCLSQFLMIAFSSDTITREYKTLKFWKKQMFRWYSCQNQLLSINLILQQHLC